MGSAGVNLQPVLGKIPLTAVGVDRIAALIRAIFGTLCVPAGQEVAIIDSSKGIFAPIGVFRLDQCQFHFAVTVCFHILYVVGIHKHRGVCGKAAAICVILDADGVKIRIILLIRRIYLAAACPKQDQRQQQACDQHRFYVIFHHFIPSVKNSGGAEPFSALPTYGVCYSVGSWDADSSVSRSAVSAAFLAAALRSARSAAAILALRK